MAAALVIVSGNNGIVQPRRKLLSDTVVLCAVEGEESSQKRLSTLIEQVLEPSNSVAALSLAFGVVGACVCLHLCECTKPTCTFQRALSLFLFHDIPTTTQSSERGTQRKKYDFMFTTN
mmetsp:Transcript_20008/g.55679  ORF Transcript_20008/g.55679 Transcript_20008/m.55679 type:complete len:119 (-) Transcript_20008:35-391(-)